MNLITLALFFVYTYGLGFSITKFTRNSENFLERNIMRVGIGLGMMPLLGVFFNLLHIPIDWRIFLIISLIPLLYFSFREFKKIRFPNKLKLTKASLSILVMLILFLLTFYIYHKGAFAYPYLEDDDSWEHARSAKYVSVEKTAYAQKSFFHYIDPYPPGYDILMGIFAQTSSSLEWTLKFFNALVISLSIIFIYFFVSEFSGNRNKALFSAFVLASVPSFLSHFIWSHALILPLSILAFYCIERIKYDKRWIYPSALVIGSILVTHVTSAVKFIVLFLIYLGVKLIAERRFAKNISLAGLYGLLLSFSWWVPMAIKYGSGLYIALAGTKAKSSGISYINYIGPLGTATRPYTLNDFIWAKTTNMINNPIGIGFVLSLLAIISVVVVLFKFKKLLQKENSWLLITLLWLVFTFLGIHGGTRIPIALMSFRFWSVFAIPLSIISAEGLFFLMSISKKINIDRIFILLIVIIGILATSSYQKYTVNTAMWPPGVLWSSMDELQGYLALKSLPYNTKIFPFCKEGDKKVVGFDKFYCLWCSDEIDFRKTAFSKTAQQANSFLKNRNYGYAVIDGKCAQEFGANETNAKLQELTLSGLFQPAQQTAGMILLKVV